MTRQKNFIINYARIVLFDINSLITLHICHIKNSEKGRINMFLRGLLIWAYYSTVTDLAKFLGWSTFLPSITAMWYESS